MKLTGSSLIDGQAVVGDQVPFAAEHRTNPLDRSAPIEPIYRGVTEAALQKATAAAQRDFQAFASLADADRARFLLKVAELLNAEADKLVMRAHEETALPAPRLVSELGRTMTQLKYFGTHLEKGHFRSEFVDEALRDRQPPRPRLTSHLMPLGPIAVFGAANFPFAYSVAGGDSASAWAAGCPVIVKAHPSHPGTSEMVGQIVVQAIRQTHGLNGVFSLLFSTGHAMGQNLVAHPAIKGVGFTGSRTGGLALIKATQGRAVPIPFYAEMSSVNPCIIMPGALSDPEALAKIFTESITQGVGQFCTNPGVILLVDSPNAKQFQEAVHEIMIAIKPGVMLNQMIEINYLSKTSALASMTGVDTLIRPVEPGAPGLFRTTSEVALKSPRIFDEVFGPSTLIINCPDIHAVEQIVAGIEGQLTMTIHAAPSELTRARDLLWLMSQKAGRIILNQVPTGVEVCDSMVHGGPYPSTSDGRSSAVGFRAVQRWQRPICYQNFPG